MGGIGMSQSVHRCLFVDPALLHCSPEGALYAAFIHRPSGLRKRRREQPDRMAVSEPMLAQHRQTAFRQRYVAVLVSLALLDVKQPAGPINIPHLQVHSFQQTQPAGIDQRQADPIRSLPHPRKDRTHFCQAEHCGQLLLFGRAYKIKSLPFPPQGALKEELDPAQSNCAGRPRRMLFILEKQEILAQFLFIDLVRRFAIMLRQLANRQ